MEVIKGIPVSPGVVIGRAFILDFTDERVPKRTVGAKDVPRELERLADALEAATFDLTELRDRTAKELGAEPAKIFEFHLSLLRDPSLMEPLRKRVEAERVTAEYAVAQAFRSLADRFRAMKGDVFQQKANDILDLDRRVLGNLLGLSETRLHDLPEPVIVVAHELTPSQTASLDRKMVLAFATDAGGLTSHTSIVARAMEIPAVVGCQRVSANLNEGDDLIVDGDRGVVILRPDARTLEQYRAFQAEMKRFRSGLREFAALEPVTKDGTRITVLGNIEFPEEVDHLIENGGEGVGLYRTEFMFLMKQEEPGEDEQFEAYRSCVERLKGRTVTIRTLDLGADKLTHDQQADPERNPALGCRGIRYCLRNLPLFKRQLRAILRASAFGPVKIMFPLVTTMLELRQAKMVMNDVMEELEEDGVAFDRTVRTGIMVEVPSSALMAKTFAREAAFLSIGTNDLIQYTLAVDRGNERVADLYTAANPGVLQLIKQTIRAGKHYRIDVSMCGEIAGELLYTMLLLGFGLRTLSMAPQQVPHVKRLIRSVDIRECERLARKVGSFDSERQIVQFLRNQTREIFPEAFDGWTAE
jgi:phosphotransferase system enzyme I (PtsI)